MKLDSIGIIVELRPLGERDVVAKIFTQDYGSMSGVIKAGLVRKDKPQVGQYGRVSWVARLDSQLGSFLFENERNLVAPYFNDTKKMTLAGSALALLASMLPERESYPALWSQTLALFATDFSYLDWEVCLLAELGYALDLERCGNCGVSTELTFISPKTARAICKDCGTPFADKLLRMPLTTEVTGYFLSQIAELPPARQLISQIYI